MDRLGSIERVLAMVAGGSGGYLATLFAVQVMPHIGAPMPPVVIAVILALGVILGARWSARHLKQR